jgi:hypothetical protein
MIRVSASAPTTAEPQRAWDLYADVAGSPDWVPFAERILSISGPAGLGQLYRERTRLLGVASDQTWEVIAWDPPRRQVQRSIAFGMESRLIIEIAPEDAGSRLTQSVELQSSLPRVVAWAHEALLGLVARHGIRVAVEAARARLDRGPLLG